MNISETGNFTDELKTLEIDIPNKKFLINGQPFGCKCSEISIWGNGRKWSVQIEKTITYKGKMEAAPATELQERLANDFKIDAEKLEKALVSGMSEKLKTIDFSRSQV